MKKIFCVFMLFYVFAVSSRAQTGSTIYLELMGNGILYSVNYDFRFNQQVSGLGGRIGLAAGEDYVALPLQVNYILGQKTHKLELGAGITAFFDTGGGDSDNDIAPGGAIMYRYQKPDGHFVFRAGIAPTFVKIDEDDTFGGLNTIYRVWPGISFGYRF